MKKSDISPLIDGGMIHEVFEHSIYGMFDITSMRKKCLADKKDILTSPIEEDLKEILLHERVYDVTRVMELTSAQYLFDPALVLYVDGGNVLLDGTHRILRRVLERYDTFSYWLITETEIIRPSITDSINLPWEGTNEEIFLKDTKKK